VDGAVAERQVRAAAIAVDEPGRAAARQARGRARAGAAAAMQAAPAIGHGRLAAAAARARAGAAARRGQEIAGGIAVLEVATARAGDGMEFAFGGGAAARGKTAACPVGGRMAARAAAGSRSSSPKLVMVCRISREESPAMRVASSPARRSNDAAPAGLARSRMWTAEAPHCIRRAWPAASSRASGDGDAT
jgi:hypothetical protein